MRFRSTRKNACWREEGVLDTLCRAGAATRCPGKAFYDFSVINQTQPKGRNRIGITQIKIYMYRERFLGGEEEDNVV